MLGHRWHTICTPSGKMGPRSWSRRNPGLSSVGTIREALRAWGASAAVVFRKLMLLVGREGWIGALRVGFKKYRYLSEFTPRRRQARRLPSDFDLRHGVTTSHVADLSELEVSGPSAPFGFRHEPSPPDRFLEITGSLSIRFEDFTFVDLGSGQGRVLLLAGLFPFRRVVGVELSHELEQVAQANLRVVRGLPLRCHRLDSLLGDAADYRFPDGPLVIYLNNPFGEPILARVVRNIEDSLARSPRPLVIVYYHPKLRDVFDRSDALRVLSVGDEVVVYASRCVDPGRPADAPTVSDPDRGEFPGAGGRGRPARRGMPPTGPGGLVNPPPPEGLA